MEGKKKFEKPELQVVEMKLAGMVCGSCPTHCEDCDDCGEYEECGAWD